MLLTFVVAAVAFTIVNWSIISLVQHHTRTHKPLLDERHFTTPQPLRCQAVMP